MCEYASKMKRANRTKRFLSTFNDYAIRDLTFQNDHSVCVC